MALTEGHDLLFTCIFRRCQQVLLMIRHRLQMLDLLLAIEHLPAVNTKDLPVRLGLNDLELVNEVSPLNGSDFDHDVLPA